MDQEPDWRVAVWSTITRELPPAFPGGPSHDPGSIVTVQTMTRTRKGSLLSFTSPSAAALSLNVARKAASDAMQLQPQFEYSSGLSPWGTANSFDEASTGCLL